MASMRIKICGGGGGSVGSAAARLEALTGQAALGVRAGRPAARGYRPPRLQPEPPPPTSGPHRSQFLSAASLPANSPWAGMSTALRFLPIVSTSLLMVSHTGSSMVFSGLAKLVYEDCTGGGGGAAAAAGAELDTGIDGTSSWKSCDWGRGSPG
jgi:hypothetical protein